MRIIAAIPNYNAAIHVIRLAKQLTTENLDAVYVLDDASTDDSLEKLYELGDKVEVIEGEANLGPAGNRNRILPYLQDEDILIFIDADMELVTTNIRPIIESLFSQSPKVGLIGGGIMNKQLKPMPYNYGLDVSDAKERTGRNIERIAKILHFRPLVWPLRKLAKPYTKNLDIRYAQPEEQTVDWVSLGHCYLKTSVFKKIGGFDGNLGYREEKLLARKIRSEGYEIQFSPQIWTKHLQLSRRSESRLFFQKYYS